MTSRRPPWPLLAEAGLTMIAASAVIRLGPFRKLGRLLGSPKSGSPVASAVEVAMIRRAVEAWARRLPWRTLCYEQGVTAYWMLRRRNRRSTLYYGAATLDGELKAHVWVRSGDTDVIGCETAVDYAELARFPDESRSAPVHTICARPEHEE